MQVEANELFFQGEGIVNHPATRNDDGPFLPEVTAWNVVNAIQLSMVPVAASGAITAAAFGSANVFGTVVVFGSVPLGLVFVFHVIITANWLAKKHQA